jgi:Ca-activated chloride channel family protein
LTYRNPQAPAPNPTTAAPERSEREPGFFEARALLMPPARRLEAPSAGMGPPAPIDDAPPRSVMVLFDNSLSMQWEKLDRNFQALETLLRGLRPRDRFHLLLFNSELAAFQPQPVAADRATVEEALNFVKASRIRGGTNLQAALEAALAQAPLAQVPGASSESYIVLLSDGGASRGTIHNGRLAAWYAQRLAQIDPARRPRTFVFAVGDDANLPLARLLGRDDGVVEWARSTEPIDFKLRAFLSKIGQRPIEGLRLTAAPAASFDMIYPLEPSWFAGSIASWVGRYSQPGQQATFTVNGARNGTPLELQARVTLPEQSLAHEHLPRTWARARVDALLEKIEREGEDRDTIDEIIRLARQYKFVTPYTSFLAAPRSLLRPRAIRPGDPVLRVRADESIVSVTALFPFGLVKQLKYLAHEDIWQTRFLAPTDMQDGEHSVRLILRDRQGRAYRESKTFVIASKPPVVRIHLDKPRYSRGEAVALRVSASNTTRTLVARMYGVAPVNLRWNEKARYNTGGFVIPADLPAGRYALRVTAEDFAHNIGSQEVHIEVAP